MSHVKTDPGDIAVLATAKWKYVRRLSSELPYPAAISGYDGLSEEIIRGAGIISDQKNGIAMREAKKPGQAPSWIIYGKENLDHMNEHEIQFGQDPAVTRLNIGPREGWDK